ncbi:MAG: maltotransferase domain-containing protein [Burkholderiaceae bacterium]
MMAMRIYHVLSPPAANEAAALESHDWDARCARAKALGFDCVLAGPLEEPEAAAGAARRHGVQLLLDLTLDDVGGADLERRARTLGDVLDAGVGGFRCLAPASMPVQSWQTVIGRARAGHPDGFFLAWTPGLAPRQVAALAAGGFDATFGSAAWWDYRSPWLLEESDRLRRVGPVIQTVVAESARVGDDSWNVDTRQAGRRLWVAAFFGGGILMPEGYEKSAGDEAVIAVNRWLAEQSAADARAWRRLSGPAAGFTAWFREGDPAQLLMVNPDDEAPAVLDRRVFVPRMPDSYTLSGEASEALPAMLEAAGAMVLLLEVALPVKASGRRLDPPAPSEPPLHGPRIAIENVMPRIDDGRFPVKRAIGDVLRVQADVFMDGHDRIAVWLLWRAADEAQWRRAEMRPLGNDRWEAEFIPERLGRYCYTVQAWQDVWGSYCHGLMKKRDAGQDVSLDVEEGRMLVAAALERARDDMPEVAAEIAALLRAVGHPQGNKPRPRRELSLTGLSMQKPDARPLPTATPEQVGILLSESSERIMRAVDHRPFEAGAAVYPLTVDRREARFSSWYELFPRSQSPSPGTHGTFRDVIDRLSAIRDMGFDTLYFPPIHPIGQTNRKGRNNALSAAPGEPGSPYAIGSAAGGHDAVHPELGTLDDFQELLGAAHDHGLEVALDFAIQCSPDHPWLGEHPDWFDWRADGSLRHAENPPKRYEDIVNPDFYADPVEARPQMALWRALRDTLLFWIQQGVRVFRVDNPHTKPLPFWQWLIAQIQAEHPDVLFLSEAFTRPKMMYRLAKLGFTQSYTYFTWRHGKQELTDYLNELNSPPAADCFRPHFFVNTPDINPTFLHSSGRPGFLIRAALAATTSGLWGMYNGFELCEARSLAGKEEYQDSEKYELRSWDWNRPGNIIAEITRLNQLRRQNPALQSHLGIRFHKVDNDQILFFSKTAPEGDSTVVVAISLDPFGRQAGTLELPLWEWGLQGEEAIWMRELYEDRRFSLRGMRHRIELAPERPFLLWSVEEAEAARSHGGAGY